MIYIGQAAKLSGASIKAIRYYESLGLLSNLSRSGSYRTFSKLDIDTIKLIKEAQRLGFKLAEFKNALVSNEEFSWSNIGNLIRQKESQINNEITSLKQKRNDLKHYSQLILECLKEQPNCSDSIIDHID